MARPTTKELTERELEVMHLFWQHRDLTATDARDRLAKNGTDLAYVTVANLVRILVEKGFLEQINDERPFRYGAVRSFSEVSNKLVRNLVQSVFNGSRELLLVQVLKQSKLTAKERAALKEILREQDK